MSIPPGSPGQSVSGRAPPAGNSSAARTGDHLRQLQDPRPQRQRHGADEMVNDELTNPAAQWSELRWLRQRWDGPMVVKGILTVEDANAAINEGADAIVVSNHGGRQLDDTPATADVLPAGRGRRRRHRGARRWRDTLGHRHPQGAGSRGTRGAGGQALLVGTSRRRRSRCQRRHRSVAHRIRYMAMALAGRPTIGSIDRSLLFPDG